MRLASLSALALATLASLGPQPALADATDEIQVYLDDLAEPGKFGGIELHVNTTPKGRKTPDYPGEVTPHHGLRITPELSWGLTETVDAGIYLPFVRNADGTGYFMGPKLRLKWLPKRAPEGGLFYGANLEVSSVGRRFAEERTGMELRPIVGYRTQEWLFAANPELSSPLSKGYRHGGFSFAPAIKVARTVASGIAVGAEYYAELGKLTHMSPSSEQAHTLYAAIDIDRHPWVMNLGVGRGLNSATDRWTAKAIVELPFGK